MSAIYRMAPAKPVGRGLMGGLALLDAAAAVWFGLCLHTWVGALILFGTTGLLIGWMGSVRNVRFIIESEGLRIRGDLWGRRIPFSALEIQKAERLPLHWNVASYPLWRVCGTELPGFKSGWYRLIKREWALVYITDLALVVRIPTTRGYSLLLSVETPDEFLTALRGGLR